MPEGPDKAGTNFCHYYTIIDTRCQVEVLYRSVDKIVVNSHEPIKRYDKNEKNKQEIFTDWNVCFV